MRLFLRSVSCVIHHLPEEGAHLQEKVLLARILLIYSRYPLPQPLLVHQRPPTFSSSYNLCPSLREVNTKPPVLWKRATFLPEEPTLPRSPQAATFPDSSLGSNLPDSRRSYSFAKGQSEVPPP